MNPALVRRSDTLPEHLQRATPDIGAEPKPVGGSRERIRRRRKQGVVDDDTVPRRTLQAECQIGAQPVGTPQIGVARGLTAQASGDRQAAGIHDRRREIGPIDGEHHAEQVAQTLAADVQLRRFEPDELVLDVNPVVAIFHRVAARIDDDAAVAGIDGRLEAALRRKAMADLDELEEL